MDRRQFFRSTAAVGAASLWSAATRAGELPAAGDVVAGKDARLKVVETKPIVLETPLDLLAQQRVTPKEILFVRNNVDLPGTNRLAPAEQGVGMGELIIREWREAPYEHVRPSARPRSIPTTEKSITLDQLRHLPQTEVEMVLQCSGNSRSLMSRRAPIKGTPWDRGGVGNVVFRGVKLSTVFEKLGVRVSSAAQFLTADGLDQPESTGPGRSKKDFEHSLPLDETLNHSLLALELNGEPLPAIHGGPVRLVTPGFYGTMHIKWLTSLTLTSHESTQESQSPRYRNPLHVLEPGSNYEYTRNNSRPNWWMNVKSIVFAPLPGAKVRSGMVTVQGVAFNDGAAALEKVLLSWDRGETWTPARLERPESRYAWTMWSATRSLSAGPHEVWSRAVDAHGRIQPLDGNLFWNPGGYEWNGVEKIPFECV